MCMFELMVDCRCWMLVEVGFDAFLKDLFCFVTDLLGVGLGLM